MKIQYFAALFLLPIILYYWTPILIQCTKDPGPLDIKAYLAACGIVLIACAPAFITTTPSKIQKVIRWFVAAYCIYGLVLVIAG